jgi:hypothetical protein
MGTIQHHTAVVVVYDFAMERAAVAVKLVRAYADELTAEALPIVEDCRMGARMILENDPNTYQPKRTSKRRRNKK